MSGYDDSAFGWGGRYGSGEPDDDPPPAPLPYGLTMEEVWAVLAEGEDDETFGPIVDSLRRLADAIGMEAPDSADMPDWQRAPLVESAKAKLGARP